MANEEVNSLKASFGSTLASTKALLAKLDQMIVEATQTNDVLEVARLRAQKAEMLLTGSARGAPAAGTRQAPTIERDTAALQAENRVRAKGLETELATLDVLKQQGMARAHYATARQVGFEAGAAGVAVPPKERASLLAGPAGMTGWTKGNAALTDYNRELGVYQGLATRAELSTNALSGGMLRLGVAESQASNAMRRHGALTTEWLGALARGETTVGELGYQVSATIGKFAGWTLAASATYGALGALFEFGKGAIDASSGVQKLTRTIDNLDRNKAEQAITGLSAATNVSVPEAADTLFLYSRSFHTLADAAFAAKNGLSVFKLDNVSVQDSMRLSTVFLQQFGKTAQQQQPIWNMLAAGQREWNARISETVPLLRASTGAVKNAGGELNQLVQLSVLATRVYPGIPGQIGTAFARGAATYTPKNLPQLQSEFGLGYGKEGTDWTQLLIDAIQKSATMSGPDRRKLAGLLFDPRYGSRIAGLFGPQAAATLDTIIGGGPKAITPQRTEGALQQELDRQLGTARERFKSIAYEAQRMGAALGASGIVNVMSGVAQGAVSVGHALRGVADAFDVLPNTAKEAIEGLVAFRLAMLFVSRTRFGSSLPLFNRLPGFAPSEATILRRELAQGNRVNIQGTSADLTATTAQASQRSRQIAIEQAKQADIQKEINDKGIRTGPLIAASNASGLKIKGLLGEREALERTIAAQTETLVGLQEQQVTLTARRRGLFAKGMSDEEVVALATGAGIDKPAGPSGVLAYASQQSSKAKKALAQKLHLEKAAMGGVAVADAEATAASVETTVAAGTAEAEALTAGAALRSTGVAIAGLAKGIVGMLSAIDPLLAAFILLPIAYSKAKEMIDKANQRAKGQIDATQDQYTSITALQQAVARNQSKTSGSYTTGNPLHDLNPFRESEDSYSSRQAASAAFASLSAAIQRARSQTFASPVRQVGYSIAELTQESAADIKAFREHRITKQEFVRRMNELTGSAQSSLEVLTAPSAKKANQAILIATVAIKEGLTQTLLDMGKRTKDLLSVFEAMDSKTLDQTIKGYSERANVYGLGGGDLSKAIGAYLVVAARWRSSTSSTGLQQVQTAQQAVVSAVNKNVEDLLHASAGATTAGGAGAALSRAVGVITQSRNAVAQWVSQMDKRYHAYPGIIKAVNEAAAQIDAQLNDHLSQVIDQQIALIKSQSALTASKISGISPEADIARAQEALNGLRRGLALARSEGASYKTIADLLTQINDGARALIKQRIDNADQIAKAQETLAVSAITGIGPAADIARAQQELSNARADLSRDQGHGAGRAKILEDQAKVNDDIRAINEQLQQRDQQLAQDAKAFIEAQAGLKESQTTNPVTQAREQLSADLQILKTIKPSDYKTYQEYQTAFMEQQTRINKDRQDVTKQYVDVQMRNLSFELHIQQITDQQYINGLRQLLRQKKLTVEERQGILTAIFDAEHQAAVSLGTDNIKVPTTYEVRRAILSAARRGRPGTHEAGAVVNNNTTTNHVAITNHITVAREADLKRVTDTISGALKSSLTGATQAAGYV